MSTKRKGNDDATAAAAAGGVDSDTEAKCEKKLKASVRKVADEAVDAAAGAAAGAAHDAAADDGLATEIQTGGVACAANRDSTVVWKSASLHGSAVVRAFAPLCRAEPNFKRWNEKSRAVKAAYKSLEGYLGFNNDTKTDPGFNSLTPNEQKFYPQAVSLYQRLADWSPVFRSYTDPAYVTFLVAACPPLSPEASHAHAAQTATAAAAHAAAVIAVVPTRPPASAAVRARTAAVPGPAARARRRLEVAGCTMVVPPHRVPTFSCTLCRRTMTLTVWAAE